MTDQLKRLRAYEVSYVPRGANLKKFLILKEDSEMAKSAAQHVDGLIAKMKLKNEKKIDVVLKELSPEDSDALKAALKVLQALGDQVDPECIQELMELIGMAPEEGAAPADAEAMKKEMMAYKERAEAAEAKVAKMGSEPAAGGEFPVKKDGTLDEEKIPAETRAMVKALWNAKVKQDEQIATVTKELNLVRDKAVTKEYEDIAATVFKNLPGTKEDLGAVLKSVAIKDPEAYKSLETVLKAANAIVAKAGLTTELGSNHQRGSTGGAGAGSAGEAEYHESIVAPALAMPIAKEKGWDEDHAVTHFITKTAEGRKAYSEYRRSAESDKRRA